MFSIRLNAPMPKPLASWGIALESLRKSSGLSQLELTHRKVITPGEYYRICRSKTGPSVNTLDKLIIGMGYTWHDWATAFESARTKSLLLVGDSKKNVKTVRASR